MNSSPSALVDEFQRTISYLRVSLTDQCNLRCVYCTPLPLEKIAHAQLLTYEELLRVIGLAVELGISKVRLTGGEPLVRRGIIHFIEGLSGLQGLNDIRLTTNGIGLQKYGQALYDASIRKLNISLDSLRPDRVKTITGVDCFNQVWQGIEFARQLGFAIKLNMVAMAGVNDDELVEFARLAQRMDLQVRFIEFMPIGNSASWGEQRFIASNEIRARIEAELGPLQAMARQRADGPARLYSFASGPGSLGFISPLSHHFCDKCNRLRLTSEGKLRSCLLSDQEADLRSLLRGGADDQQLKELIIKTIRSKPQGHRMQRATDRENCHGRMSRIGG